MKNRKKGNSAQPLVSIIVPAFCHEEHILPCISSIWSQSYENIELVILDDASTDSTYEVVSALLSSAFRSRFANVILERNSQNLGAAANIEKGIQKASGDYIAIINSDDVYFQDRIEKIISKMVEEDSELGFSLAEIIFDDSIDDFNADSMNKFMLHPLKAAFALQQAPTVGFQLIKENWAVSTGNLIFARSLYTKVGGFCNLKYCHDWDFLLQSLFWTEPAFVNEVLYYYRIHPGNSFASLEPFAGVETEVVLRRFFRRGLKGISPNKLFPNEYNWPGYFELFVTNLGLAPFLNLERGLGGPFWRTYSGSLELRKLDGTRLLHTSESV